MTGACYDKMASPDCNKRAVPQGDDAAGVCCNVIDLHHGIVVG